MNNYIIKNGTMYKAITVRGKRVTIRRTDKKLTASRAKRTVDYHQLIQRGYVLTEKVDLPSRQHKGGAFRCN